MPRVRPEDLVRHFRENGLKLLFHDPGNVRELLALRDPDRAARIDFTRMTIDPTPTWPPTIAMSRPISSSRCPIAASAAADDAS